MDIADKSGFPNRLLHEKAAERIRIRMENRLLRPRPGDQQELERLELVLIGPPLPEGMAHLYGWFIELSNTRGSNGFAPTALSPSEIRDWSEQAIGQLMTPWEFGIIRALDAKWRSIYFELNKPEKKEKPAPLD